MTGGEGEGEGKRERESVHVGIESDRRWSGDSHKDYAQHI